ncbi:hypothetical protein HUJ04_010822 [Dendroctonus ponderosae]|nr:hypothetical protein HUJ04_010822 [Dendroctonus ponderosae]
MCTALRRKTPDVYDLRQTLKLTRKEEVNLVIRDFNAKVGNEKDENVVGGYGLGLRNERRYCHLNACSYTWKSPADNEQNIVMNQIDFITVNRRFRNAVTSVLKTYPGAAVPSDHILLLSTLRLHLKKDGRVQAYKKYQMDHGRILGSHGRTKKIKEAREAWFTDKLILFYKTLKRWKQCMQDFLDDENRGNRDESRVDHFFPMGEVASSIDKLKYNKAAGPDAIRADLLKLIEAHHMDIITELFNHI